MAKAIKSIHILSVLAAAGLTQLFFVLCLLFLRESKGETLFQVILWSGTIFNLALFATETCAFLLKRSALYKSCIILYVLLVFSAIVFYILLKTGFMEIFKSEEKLEEYLERTGVWMSILFIVLQFLQVIVLPIPSTVTVVAGSALFGPLKGSIFSLIGILLGSLTAFLIGRFAGFKVVAWIIGEETLQKWQKKIKGKDKLLLSAMFLLPVFPDDVLCFVAGLSSMSLPLFFTIILISRILAIFTTSYSISLIPFNTWWGILIWSILFVLIAVMFVVLYKKSDSILGWFEKKFHPETRVKDGKPQKNEFTVEVIGPDGTIVTKGVDEGEKPPPSKVKK